MLHCLSIMIYVELGMLLGCRLSLFPITYSDWNNRYPLSVSFCEFWLNFLAWKYLLLREHRNYVYTRLQVPEILIKHGISRKNPAGSQCKVNYTSLIRILLVSLSNNNIHSSWTIQGVVCKSTLSISDIHQREGILRMLL